MEKDNNNLKYINVNFTKSTNYNVESDTRFAKVEIKLLHTGLNLNGSIFEKEVVNNALPTLVGTPILAYIEENSEGELDFSDHRMTVIRNGEGDLIWKYLGSAIGYIPENYNARWELEKDNHGVDREYLYIDGLLWTKFDDPIDILNRRGFVSQSMELHSNYTGNWNTDGNFVFESFSFYGACLLGQDTLPAMENSTATMNFSKDNDTLSFVNSKYKEFMSILNKEGGNLELEELKTVTEEVELEHSTVEEVETIVEELIEVVEELEDTVEELDVVSEVEEVVSDDYTISKEEFESTLYEVSELKLKINELTEELIELREFKRNTEELELSSKFENQLTEDEIKEVFSDKSKSIVDLEKELFAIVGMKNFTTIKSEVKRNSVSVELDDAEIKPEVNPYMEFFKKSKK